MFMQFAASEEVQRLYFRPGAAEAVDPGKRKLRLSG
jgi:hypothetical protein